VFLSELHRGRVEHATGDVRPVVGCRGNPFPRTRFRRDRRLYQHVLQRARARNPIATVSPETVGSRFRRRDRARLSARGARRPLLSRQAVAARGPSGTQHVRADVGPFPTAQHVRGPVQDKKPDTVVRAPAGPTDRTHLSYGHAARQPAQRVHVLRRVDQLRARRPAEPQFHGGVRGPGDRFHGFQVVRGVQARGQAARGGVVVVVAVVSQPFQPVRMRVRVSRAERVH